MVESNSAQPSNAEPEEIGRFQLRKAKDRRPAEDSEVHVFGPGQKIVCATDTKGHKRPGGRSRFDIWVDAPEGRIPLWARGVTLRWRFQEHSFEPFEDPAGVKAQIRRLFGEAVLAWGHAAPVRFTEAKQNWDFEIAIREHDRCTPEGCVLARAFFPDAGQHELTIYPMMFTQDPREQLETFMHELGHVFGLRHFFANLTETEWPSVLFGQNDRFTIMNYGSDSMLTDADRNDLTQLYQLVWSGQLPEINGTQIKLVEPFHMSGASPESVVAVGEIQTRIQPIGQSAGAG